MVIPDLAPNSPSPHTKAIHEKNFTSFCPYDNVKAKLTFCTTQAWDFCSRSARIFEDNLKNYMKALNDFQWLLWFPLPTQKMYFQKKSISNTLISIENQRIGKVYHHYQFTFFSSWDIFKLWYFLKNCPLKFFSQV